VSKKHHAHAEVAYNEGDLFEIQEGRPISKNKAKLLAVFLQPLNHREKLQIEWAQRNKTHTA
jgi:hypothetical protein